MRCRKEKEKKNLANFRVLFIAQNTTTPAMRKTVKPNDKY